SHILN
ncbi:peptidyl-dipeptidase dcp, partial [Escherichia coli 8.0566]